MTILKTRYSKSLDDIIKEFNEATVGEIVSSWKVVKDGCYFCIVYSVEELTTM